MQSTNSIEEAISHVVMAARLRMRELEVRSHGDDGEWRNEEDQDEYAQLANALAIVSKNLAFEQA